MDFLILQRYLVLLYFLVLHFFSSSAQFFDSSLSFGSPSVFRQPTRFIPRTQTSSSRSLRRSSSSRTIPSFRTRTRTRTRTRPSTSSSSSSTNTARRPAARSFSEVSRTPTTECPTWRCAYVPRQCRRNVYILLQNGRRCRACDYNRCERFMDRWRKGFA